jgi:16S rRNA (guanine527-N7)-methyltransferase
MQTLYREARDLLGIDLTPGQLESFELYRRELTAWNQIHNLTAVRDPEQIRLKHFLDSMSCYLAMRGSPMASVVDVGAGAGFPGIPVKILCPSIRLVLVESIGKKVEFLKHVVSSLALADVEVLQERAEVLGHASGHREQYDWALARAVAAMPVVMEYLLPFVRIGGSALALKGESGPAEAQSAARAIQLLGGQLNQITQVSLPGVNEERFLLAVLKKAATPGNYPRRVGIPAKRPL